MTPVTDQCLVLCDAGIATAASLPARLSAEPLAERLAAQSVQVIAGREAMEVATGRIAGSLNMPLSRLAVAELPAGPSELVCQSGNGSARSEHQLRTQGHAHPVTDLKGGLANWQQAGLPLRRMANSTLPLMRQVQIAAGSLVLLGLILSHTVVPGRILLTWFVGAGRLFVGNSGFYGMARLLALMPWNRVAL